MAKNQRGSKSLAVKASFSSGTANITNKLPFSAQICIAAFALIVRSAVGLWGYSGNGSPPMFGDFEAQRHWMELTTALPIGEWYFQTGNNDLQYWGLDYPPLTAYVSYAFGALAHMIFPELVIFNTSRGHESATGKAFMRGSVLLCDVIIFIPAAFLVVDCASAMTASVRNKVICLLVALLAPPLVLIDHGHFQYNGVCIGLSLLAAVMLVKEHDVCASVLFSLALNFKQMGLYYAPVFFFALLGNCFRKSTIKAGFIHLCKIGGTVIATFGVMWAPFCMSPLEGQGCPSSLLQILHRMFPFARGIFEDKVANFWYVSSVVFDFRGKIPQELLVKASLALTLMLLAPTATALLKRQVTADKTILAMVSASLAFFLCSFQVHEKSLLLSSVPATFYFSSDPLFVAWFQVLTAFTLVPLLLRDGQVYSYIIGQVGFLAVVSGYFVGDESSKKCNESESNQLWVPLLKKVFIGLSSLGMVALHVGQLFISPPPHYPDLYPALFAIYGFLNLVVAYLYFVLTLYLLQ